MVIEGNQSFLIIIPHNEETEEVRKNMSNKKKQKMRIKYEIYHKVKIKIIIL